MKEPITYAEFSDEDFHSLVRMAAKLWKDFNDEELRKLLLQMKSAGNKKIWLAKNSSQENIGFIVASIRTDYVEGAEKSPTGYLEGIFVEPQYRKLGIAKKFVQMAEDWLKKNNCTQIGSDTWLTSQDSRNFHKKIGFWEEDELVHFLKNIK